MFVAWDASRKARVVSLDHRRSTEELREGARSGALACPECRQLLVFRAGDKRRHFAHRRLADCLLAHASAELIEARAVLYDWLVEAHGDAVEIEVRPRDSTLLPRPIDVVVSLPDGSRLAVWLFDLGVRNLERRDSIREFFATFAGVVQYVFSSTMLSPPMWDGSFQVTKTERDFAQLTPFDEEGHKAIGSLHYLQASEGTLVTRRRLELVHSPNMFTGKVRSSALRNLVADARGFHHKGELDELLEQQRREAIERQERDARVAQQQPNPSWSSTSKAADRADGGGTPWKPRFVTAPRSRLPPSSRREPATDAPVIDDWRKTWLGRCKDCGELKRESECAEYKRITNECVCKACMRLRPIE